jgi:hypothetical protein
MYRRAAEVAAMENVSVGLWRDRPAGYTETRKPLSGMSGCRCSTRVCDHACMALLSARGFGSGAGSTLAALTEAKVELCRQKRRRRLEGRIGRALAGASD